KVRPSRMEVHDSQVPHGSPASASDGLRLARSVQLMARLRMRAVVVLPTPRVPVNRYACATLPVATSKANVILTWFWPATSLHAVGRYFRYRVVMRACL